MMDYLVAIIAAIVAAVVIFSIFNNVSDTEVISVEQTAEKKKPKGKKSKNNKAADDSLDEEANAILEQELARGPQGMNTDTDDIRPQTWEQIRNRQEAKAETRKAHVTVKERSNRQKVLDRELGFQVVEKPEHKPKTEEKQEEKAAPDSNELVERMLQLFFKNNSGGNTSRPKTDHKTEKKEPTQAAGGKVIIKGEMSKKTW